MKPFDVLRIQKLREDVVPAGAPARRAAARRDADERACGVARIRLCDLARGEDIRVVSQGARQEVTPAASQGDDRVRLA